MAGFTKRPWRVEESRSGHYAICSADNMHVCQVMPREDAFLIAAAPDLFEALQNTLSLLKAFTSEDDDVARAVRKQAEAALLQAEGRGE